MQYTIDRPNIQLDAADCTAIKNALESVNDASHVGFICRGPNVMLDGADLLALDLAVDGVATAVNTANLNLTAADVTAITPSIT